MLNKITIKGYRSIKEASIELGSLNVLIGANGSGKSNLVSFFKMLNEMMANRLQAYIGSTGRARSFLHFGPKVTPEMEAELEFQAKSTSYHYFMTLSYASGDSMIFAHESLESVPKTGSPRGLRLLSAGHQETQITRAVHGPKRTSDVFRHFSHLLSQCRVFHFDDTSQTAAIRQFCYINDNKELMPDAGNLAAMLYAYRLTHDIVYRRIISTIQKIMPDFDDFDLEPSRLNSNEIILNWRKKGREYLFGPHQISDGTLRAMAILTLFLQPENDLPKVIILDGPELGLHPQALELVAGVMRSVSDKAQVIVATQSQSFLNNFEPAEIITVESHQSETCFRRLKPEELEVWLEDYSIGELWQRNVLGGSPLP